MSRRLFSSRCARFCPPPHARCVRLRQLNTLSSLKCVIQAVDTIRALSPEDRLNPLAHCSGQSIYKSQRLLAGIQESSKSSARRSRRLLSILQVSSSRFCRVCNLRTFAALATPKCSLKSAIRTAIGFQSEASSGFSKISFLLLRHSCSASWSRNAGSCSKTPLQSTFCLLTWPCGIGRRQQPVFEVLHRLGAWSPAKQPDRARWPT
jgi:hypothetical protein